MFTRLDPDQYAEKFAAWLDFIAENHHASRHRGVEEAAFTPLRRPLDQARVALVSSAGVHLDDQVPFHVETVAGDSGHRLIPDGADTARLRFTHTHYDTAAAEKDPNVVFPLDRLHEAVAAGRIGSTSGVHVGLMGFNPDPSRIADETAPAVVDLLAAEGVDVVVMVPG